MLLNFILLILIIAPISLFIHELGHLFGAKFLKADRVTIYIGTGRQVFSYQYKEMNLKVFLLVMFHAHTESERKLSFSNKEYALITFMGPLFSLITTGVFGLLLFQIQLEIVLYFMLFNLWLTLINLLPFKIKNQKSDGYLIWTLLK